MPIININVLFLYFFPIIHTCISKSKETNDIFIFFLNFWSWLYKVKSVKCPPCNIQLYTKRLLESSTMRTEIMIKANQRPTLNVSCL